MGKSAQLKLFPKQNYNRTTHGGHDSLGKRKLKRPLDRRKSLHIVMRSSKARRELSLSGKAHRHTVATIAQRQAKRWGVRILRFSNVGNHLHLSVRFSSPEYFRNFLRTIAAMIARTVTGARRGNKFGKFWDTLAFTRVIRTFTEEKILDRYLHANQIEATD